MVRQIDVKRELSDLYCRRFGEEAVSVVQLPGAGSDRRYFRIADAKGSNVIGVFGADAAENESFCGLAEYFLMNGCRVPEVYAVSDDRLLYLQEDLGDLQLFSVLGSEEAPTIVEKCMRELVKMQTLPAEEWERYCFNAPFSLRQVMWDLNYFKYEYLKSSAVTFNEDALEDDFERFSEHLLSIPPEMVGFMYRDCQSRNVMLPDGHTSYWIDFQGGRKGPCVYDAVSFLWQAKAAFPATFRERTLEIYARAFSERRGVAPEAVKALARRFVLFRTLQVLGAYGFRGLVERKAHFIESIPGALTNLRELIAVGEVDAYPELKRVCTALTEDERFVPAENDGRLRVEVYSFSYKKGYPTNFTGNGGGFMFDCRGLHNPGRYAEYKPLTGLDRPVRDFLEERGEIQPFLGAAWEMTDQAVATYLRRGFTSLQIGFGCTGGRHRSVYSADCTARHIAEKFPDAIVTVIHREQNIKETL